MLFDEDAELDDEFVSTAFASDDVRAMEKPLLDSGVPLMHMAASAAAMSARVMLARAQVSPDDARIVLLAGGGDNGGDGLFAAAELADQGATVTAVAVGRSLHAEGLAAFDRAGGEVIVLDPRAEIEGHAAPADEDEAADLFDEALDIAQDSHLIIDAMTGIGLQGALRGIPAHIAEELGRQSGLPESMALPSGENLGAFPLVLAVDVPSGVGVNDGALPGPYIPADVTATFGAMKPCALLPPSAYVCGQLVLVDFDFDTARFTPAVEAMTSRTAAQIIRLPHVADSKYSRGVTGLITGSQAYPGAAVLSCHAAAVSNVGMIRYRGPARAEDLVLREVPEAVMGGGHVQSWVVGSGVPNGEADEHGDDAQRREIRALLARYDAQTEGSADMPPVVVDAGALDLLPETCAPQVLITPHAGELARLISERDEDVTADEVMAEPLHWATRAWELTGATVLLKGAITVIVGYDEEGGPSVITSGSGPAWLSSAGAGDVLAGTLGAVLAQGADTLRIMPDQVGIHAATGAFLHGLAAQLASESLQTGWRRPVVYDPDSAFDFLEAMQPVSNMLAHTGYLVGSLGHPITAKDVIGELPHAFALLIRMYDDHDDDGIGPDDLSGAGFNPDGPAGGDDDDPHGDDPVGGDIIDDDAVIEPDDDADDGDGVYLDADRDYTDEELDALMDRLMSRR
ncbi:bifunctional ADP-dependent NAD(P)H-hydrate dehydratase/NAD(P)H-hydrate epimerase [Bifidobacterium simiarum]|uniref:bifunctional ADP-dependent NAD(P)H-hydrate dehydratase/NAD(P)H-hydrate epimerase n=1 Tax=Bifidobacterium simiarum TaxID=2045441 RepID=UPI001BDCDD9C|nr:bifunctional ADP-dependent NAD(P)H-hydrate dehydratase/NAD(P)H-hydrate epimerase [Bifidobacterium simiarum]MBT1165708.1 bifunctional ADP-dependent NAD(P)H-hydrate dehydratase/NAD(P)H-hydrate epimerase [Bifidobacterium simiarum]